MLETKACFAVPFPDQGLVNVGASGRSMNQCQPQESYNLGQSALSLAVASAENSGRETASMRHHRQGGSHFRT
jgi:hypothetical protein